MDIVHIVNQIINLFSVIKCFSAYLFTLVIIKLILDLGKFFKCYYRVDNSDEWKTRNTIDKEGVKLAPVMIDISQI